MHNGNDDGIHMYYEYEIQSIKYVCVYFYIFMWNSVCSTGYNSYLDTHTPYGVLCVFYALSSRKMRRAYIVIYSPCNIDGEIYSSSSSSFFVIFFAYASAAKYFIFIYTAWCVYVFGAKLYSFLRALSLSHSRSLLVRENEQRKQVQNFIR